MEKILFRKLLSDCLIFFLITLFSASIIIWVFQAVNFLDIMIEDGRDYLVYINYSLLNFPKILSKVLPFVFFFSFFYVISKYELKNELIIFWNFGVNKIQLINFLFIFSVFLTFMQITLAAFVVPNSLDKARSFLRTSSVNFLESFIKQKKFNDTIRNVTIYSDGKDKNGNLLNIYLKKEENINNFQITYAKKGKFVDKRDSQILVLHEGETINFINNKITNFRFSKSDFNLKNLETNTTTYIKTQEVSTSKLIKCYLKINNINFFSIDTNNVVIENCVSTNLNNVIKELYKRFIIPFYIPPLMLIILCLLLKSKENINYFNYRILIFLFGLLLIISSEMSLRFIKIDILENSKIFIIPLIIIILIYSIIYFNLNSYKEKK
jgi:lipopolysaccharide export system permease protein